MRTRFSYAGQGPPYSANAAPSKALKPFTYPTDQGSSYPDKWSSTFSSPVKALDGFEFATDLPKRNTRNTWNDFDHYKMSVLFPGAMSIPTCQRLFLTYPLGYIFNIPANMSTIASQFGGDSAPMTGVNPLYVGSGTGYKVVPVAGLQNLQFKALRAMLPGIRPRVLSLAEIYQLKDLPRINKTADMATKLITKIKALAPNSRIAEKLLFGYTKKLPLAKLLLVLPAELYLQVKFNILPLISDIAAIKDSCSTVAGEVAKLLQEQNRPQISHTSYDLSSLYARQYSVVTEPRAVTIPSTPPYGKYYTKATGWLSYNSSTIYLAIAKESREVLTSGCSFHAAIRYSYRFGKLQEENLAYFARLDSLGLGVNPIKELWELLPWSFVVDWVVDVSQYLDNLEDKHVKPVTAIHNWCWSQKIQRRTTFLTTFKQSGLAPEWNYSVPDVNTRTIVEEAYKRGTDGLNVTSALSGSGISSAEFILAGALAVTRIRT